MRRVIDVHLHLDERLGSAGDAARALDKAVTECGIARGVVLHLETQPWSIEEVGEALSDCPRLVGFANVHPHDENAAGKLANAVEKLGFIGLKMHPRLQHYRTDGDEAKRLVAAAGDIGVPVLIDAFPDGDFLMQGFDPLDYARLALAAPKTRMIIGHFGGHYCLDFMMLAKRLPNVWLDFSYSLLYFRGSTVPQNLSYCFRSMRYERIMYGSDYPDRPLDTSLALSTEELERLNVGAEALDKLMYDNAREFFAWQDL